MSRSTSSAPRRVSMPACLVASAGTARAQYGNSIQDVVTDTNRAVVPGDDLTQTDLARGERQTMKMSISCSWR
jgi:hypothetical protein